MEKATIEKISEEIRPVLTGFLTCEQYQETFKDMALALGYEGDDIEKVRACLFTVDANGNIGFCLTELNDMFFEYQTIESVKNSEPYKTLLEQHPEKSKDVAKLAKRILKGEEVTQEDLLEIFN